MAQRTQPGVILQLEGLPREGVCAVAGSRAFPAQAEALGPLPPNASSGLGAGTQSNRKESSQNKVTGPLLNSI